MTPTGRVRRSRIHTGWSRIGTVAVTSKGIGTLRADTTITTTAGTVIAGATRTASGGITETTTIETAVGDKRVPRGIVRIMLATIVAIPLTLHALTRGSPEPRTATVQLLAINDFHGNLEPPDGANGQIHGTRAGGAEYLATHLANAMAGHPSSIVVAAGDVIGASPLVSALFHDEPTITAMNAMHLAVASVGNHEFDKGVPELLRLTRGGCHPVDGCQGSVRFSGARFQYLSANVVHAGSRTPLFPATAVRTIGGVKIGFIGETLQGTPRIVAPAGTRGLTFL
jgi:5'-nucleotidase